VSGNLLTARTRESELVVRPRLLHLLRPSAAESLVGVSYRLPVMHDGCAETLRARFDPDCGGDRHGNTGHLVEEQLGDLVTYPQTL